MSLYADLILFVLPLSIFILILNELILSPLLKNKLSSRRLPPGPWKLPVIGSLHHLSTATLPHHSLRSLSNKHGPLMHLQLGQISVIVVSDPELALEIFKTHDINFAQRPKMLSFEVVFYGSCNISFAPLGQYWRTIRKICVNELFTPKRIASFNFVREKEVMGMIKSISEAVDEGLPINLSKKFFSLSSDVVSRVAFGAKTKEKEKFVECVKEFIHLSTGLSAADLFPSFKWLSVVTGFKYKLENIHQEVDKIVSVIIEEHKQKRLNSMDEQEDLVDVLLKIQENGTDLEVPITMETVKALLMDMFTGGTDTSAVVLEWAMSELIRHPSILAKLQEEVRRIFAGKEGADESGINELKYMKLVLMETLRLHPPACLHMRECIESCKIGGYDIPSNTNVLINNWAISRDPKLWGEDCEVFNPERFVGSSIDYRGNYMQFLPFGSGRRMCPAMLFGMANVELPLAKLLYYFDWKLPANMKPQDLDITEALGGIISRKSELILVAIPRFTMDGNEPKI